MHKKRKNYLRFFGIAAIFAMILITAAVTVIKTDVFDKDVRTVVINDNGKNTEITTTKTGVKDILIEAEVEIEEHDYINVGLDEEITDSTYSIDIKRGIPVKVVYEEEILEFHTVEETVGDAFEKEGINISDLDRLHNNETLEKISMEEAITEALEIKVIEVTEEIEEEITTLQYETITNKTDKLNKGKVNILQQGKTGEVRKTFLVRYENGKMISKNQVSKEIISEPIAEIKEIGTQETFATNKGVEVAYKDAFVYQATAYTAASDPYNGLTATGARAKVGIVAVDRKVIPLGTKLYVQSIDSTKDYGYCIAGDTGVIGKRIDLYYNTLGECYTFGRRDVKIYVLKDQSIDVFAER